MALLLGSDKKSSPSRTLPLVPVRGVVVFPHTEVRMTFGRPKSIAAVEAASKKDGLLCLVSQKNPRISKPVPEDFYRVATLVKIVRLLPSEEIISALVRGIARVKIEAISQQKPFFKARLSQLPETFEKGEKIEALAQFLRKNFKKALSLGKSADLIDLMAAMRLMEEKVPHPELVDQISAILDAPVEEKQKILETASLKKRMEQVAEHLSNEIKVLNLEQSIQTKTKDKFEKSVRDAMLRERKKIIEKELGEEDEENQELRELRQKIKEAKMPQSVSQKAKKELKRYSRLNPQHPERGYIRTYLDWLVELPWSFSSPNKTSIPAAAKILNQDHYGLEKIKERIVEYLAVMKLRGISSLPPKTDKTTPPKEDLGGPTILCFVGPPGVGKTSIGKSIARALGRKFVRMSLGGIRDEAEIRGHRRTYVGAMPGRIVQGIKNAQTNNPVFMLDEIDKVGADFRGDPSAALLEALDPEQNFEFSDHYLEVPFNLSKVMFITTANVLHTIPPALRDRMEVIQFPGYTEDEKYNIAKNFLWQKQLRFNGLGNKKITIQPAALREVITRYTREAGVRELERNLATICRKLARKTAEKKKYSQNISKADVKKYLGPPKFRPVLAEKKDEVGMATGLAYTQVGGDVLFIEVALMPGKGNLLLTGKLGKVMKESGKAAFSYVRRRWEQLKLAQDFYKKLDVHIHVPEGAIPKDGPSAGVAIATALVSALTRKPTYRDVGMTGEITLRGRVLEVGGIKEKVIAAHRAGLKTVILPKDNKKDLEDVPAKVKKDIKFLFADHIDEVLKSALKKTKKPVPDSSF